MKAADWVAKLAGVADVTPILLDFFEETKKLCAERTKNSDKTTIGTARDGALREQKQKWEAIRRRLGWNNSSFEEVLPMYAPELAKAHEDWKQTFSKVNREEEQELADDKVTTKTNTVVVAKPPMEKFKKKKKLPKGGPGRELAAKITSS